MNGWTTTSGSSWTDASIHVVAGSTIVTPFTMCASLIRSRSTAAASASSTRLLIPIVSAASSARHAPAPAAGRDDVRDRVGQVELALRVPRVELAERVAKRLRVEDVDRRVELADRALLVVRVSLLDDLADAAVLGADDAPVRQRLLRLDREDRDRRAPCPMLRDELLEQAGGDERRGRVEHEHRAGEAVERLLRGRDRVAGPARVLLHRDDDAVVVLVARVGRGDDDDRVGAGRARGLEHPVDDASPEQRMQVLRHGRLHPGAEPAGHDDSCEVGAHGSDGWGARIRTWDRGTKTRCLTAWLRPIVGSRV